MSVDDLERFGEVLGVPADVLLMDEHEALRWVAEHRVQFEGAVNNYGNRHNRRHLHIRPSPCMRETPGQMPVRSPLVVVAGHAA